jgi:hypothetical protein
MVRTWPRPWLCGAKAQSGSQVILDTPVRNGYDGTHINRALAPLPETATAQVHMSRHPVVFVRCVGQVARYGGCADRIRSQAAWDPFSQKRPPEPLSCGSQAIEMYRRGDPFQLPPIRVRTTIKSRHAHCQRLKTGIVTASRIRSNSNLPSTGSFSTPAVPEMKE